MINAAVLGVTGSIGQTALRGIRQCPDQIRLCGATYHSRKPEGLDCPLVQLDGNQDTLKQFIEMTKPDVVLNGISGSEGLYASLTVIESGVTLALANKESVVMGGDLLFDYARSRGVRIIPVDSEHSALDELIQTNGLDNISKLVITASGGPFRNLPLNELENITPERAVKHPTWNMGPKISIDSSTLANKGLEVIEAHYLFGFDENHIEVVIHPQSIVHSMVRTVSGQVYAQMSPPDMVFPIMRALLDGSFTKSVGKDLDFSMLDLHFEKLDSSRFPFVRDAFECVRLGGVLPTVYNTANEIAVRAFVDHRISYPMIYETVHDALERQWNTQIKAISDIRALQDEVLSKIIL